MYKMFFQVLRMYWLDAFEENLPGVVFLIGKVLVDKTYVSCCTIVENIPRRYFLLPREKVFFYDYFHVFF